MAETEDLKQLKNELENFQREFVKGYIQNVTKKDKDMKNIKERFRGMEDKMRRYHIEISGVSEGKYNDYRQKKIFKVILV